MLRRTGFTRLHIVSCAPRSGTTLLTELMRHGFAFDSVAPHEMSLFNRPRNPGDLVLTKNPVDIVTVAPLLRWWHDLWVINVVRDPRDVVVSQHRGAPGQYYVGLNRWNEGFAHGKRLRGHRRVLELRYEDLTLGPDAVQERIARWMPRLEPRGDFSCFHRNAQPDRASLNALSGVRPVSTSSVGGWRNHKPRVATQVARHGPIDATLIELGYETDSRWRNELAATIPDGLRSHHPEFPSLGMRLGHSAWRLRNTVRTALSLEPRVEVKGLTPPSLDAPLARTRSALHPTVPPPGQAAARLIPPRSRAM